MHGIRFALVTVVSLSAPFWTSLNEARAQSHIGNCTDMSRNQTFAVFDNFYMEQFGNPMNNGFAMLDPSGITFMRVPSADPWNLAFFVDWQGVLVQVSSAGWHAIGNCQFASGFVQPINSVSLARPGDLAVRTPQGLLRLPEGVGDPLNRYMPPLLSSPSKAEQCLEGASDEDEFADCMLKDMLGKKELNVYKCAQEGDQAVDVALCSIGANGGPNERKIVENVQRCRDEHGDDWEEYPVCMMEDEMSQDQARLVNCLKQQAERAEITLMGTAVCYGAGSFNPNPELQIAMECAVSTNGEPMAFAGCAGGRLTARELTKCFTDGFGGDGCFGENNEIVKGLREVGIDVENILGPSNDLVQAWNTGVNDLQNGPGPTNDGVRVLTNIGNDFANGLGPSNDVVKVMDQAFSGFGLW